MATRRDGPRYRRIYPLFWRDDAVRKLSGPEKLVALYCLTSHQSNRIGLFAFSVAMAAEDLGSTDETFTERFDRVISALRWQWDSAARVLYIPSWWQWNPPDNANTLIGNLKDLAEVPETKLFKEFTENTQHLSEALSETFAERIPKRYRTQEQEQEQEQEQGMKTSSSAQTANARSKPAAIAWTPEAGFTGITADDRTRWAKAYPALDLDRQLATMDDWLRNNPEKAHRSRWGRFVSNWLKRSQDRGGDVASNKPSAHKRSLPSALTEGVE